MLGLNLELALLIVGAHFKMIVGTFEGVDHVKECRHEVLIVDVDWCWGGRSG